MNTQIVRFYMFLRLILALCVLALAGCSSKPRVGELRNESQSVELGGEESVNVKINFGAGNLKLAGGAEKLLEAYFIYNVAELKPEVEFTNGTLVVQQPETESLPVLQGITGFRNEWNLQLNNKAPMNMSVDMGAGDINLQLAGLSLTGLDITLGAGNCTLVLSGDWERNMDITIDTGAATITVILPKNIGVRIEVDQGPTMIDVTGLTQDGNFYINDAYGVSDVTLNISMTTGIGLANLVVEN